MVNILDLVGQMVSYILWVFCLFICLLGFFVFCLFIWVWGLFICLLVCLQFLKNIKTIVSLWAYRISYRLDLTNGL